MSATPFTRLSSMAWGIGPAKAGVGPAKAGVILKAVKTLVFYSKKTTPAKAGVGWLEAGAGWLEAGVGRGLIAHSLKAEDGEGTFFEKLGSMLKSFMFELPLEKSYWTQAVAASREDEEASWISLT